MATRYWVGGTGNWDASTTTHWGSASGVADNASVPTSSDDVVFDTLSNATAYTVTITATANCANFTMGAPLAGKVTWAGSSQLNIFGNSNLSGGTAGITRTFTGAIVYSSTATGKTVTMNGVTTASFIQFVGVGGGWTLQDTLNNGSSSFLLSNGTLDTNNQTVTCGNFIASGSATRTLTLGSSTINSAGSPNLGGTNMTFNVGTSTINMTGATVIFTGGSRTYNVLTFNNTNIAINDVNTFATLTVNTGATKLGSVTFGGNQTITGTFTCNGNSVTNRVLICSSVTGTARTITAATVAITNADLRDLTGAGAGSWNLASISGNSGDCGGNTSITLTTAADQHWIKAAGAGGSWSGGATNWTTRTPLPQDDVYFDFAFGTSQTITGDMPRLGKSISFTGATWTTALTLSLNQATSIFGSFTSITGLTHTNNAVNVTFEGRSSYTLDTKSINFGNNFVMDAPGGTLTLQVALSGASSRTFALTKGTFNAVSFDVTFLTFIVQSFASSILTMGSGTWTCTGTGAVFTANNSSVINAGTSTIKITDASATGKTFAGSGKTYNNLWFAVGAGTASLTVSGSNTFNDFRDSGTVAHSILFTAGTTNSVSTFTVTGTVGNVVTINSTTTAIHTLKKTSPGNISSDYLNIQHSVATPSNTWYAGLNSTNNQGVATAGSGWLFQLPVTKSQFLAFM